jgi:hypothetical protein
MRDAFCFVVKELRLSLLNWVGFAIIIVIELLN